MALETMKLSFEQQIQSLQSLSNGNIIVGMHSSLDLSLSILHVI
jgi:hypothetical protein